MKSLIQKFFDEVIFPNFKEAEMVCDIYIEKSRVYIVDFGEWSENTSSILFTWEELNQYTGDDWIYRVISSEDDCRLSRARTLLGPVELEHMNEFDLSGQFNFLK